LVDNSDAAAARFEAGDGRSQKYGTVDARLHVRKLRSASRCVAAIPTLKALHDRARAASMLVAYTLPGGGKIIDDGIAPREGEVVDQKPGGPDKFLGDDLDQRLKAHGIKTVILCGTSAQGVGLGTGAAAAQRGYYVIYPVDCLLSESAFREAYAAWHMAGGGPPVTTKWVTVTRSDMIAFENSNR
jgi:hypothetical protein